MTRRLVNLCHEWKDPPMVMAWSEIRCLAARISAGPTVAAFGGTAVRSPLAPKQPCREFCAMVKGLRVQRRVLRVGHFCVVCVCMLHLFFIYAARPWIFFLQRDLVAQIFFHQLIAFRQH